MNSEREFMPKKWQLLLYIMGCCFASLAVSATILVVFMVAMIVTGKVH